MSPEQAEGRNSMPARISSASATVLYEMATGRRPFTGGSAALHPREDPERGSEAAQRASSLRSHRSWKRSILRCLRKDPDAALSDDGGSEGRAGRHRCGVLVAAAGTQGGPCTVAWRWVWAGLLPIGLAAGYLGWLASRPAEPAEAAAGRAADHASRPGALSIPLSRRQPRRLHVDGPTAGQHGHLSPTDRRRLSAAAHD